MDSAPRPPESLVQYENPIRLEGAAAEAKLAERSGIRGEVKPASAQVEDILNSILPPR